MTVWQRTVLSLCLIASVFFLMWLINRMMRKTMDQKWNKLLEKSLSKILTFIGLLISFYITTYILDLSDFYHAIANKIFISLSIISCTFIVASIATGAIDIYKQNSSHAIAAATLTINMAHAAIFIIGLLVLLNYFGIAITPMLTAMGIGGVAIALGLQDTLSNIFAGIYIIWAGRMKIGDYIKLSTGEEGYVHDIAWRETRMRMSLDNILTIPNSLIAKVAIINYSNPSKDVGFIFYVGIAYDSDLEHVQKVTQDIAREVSQSIPGALPNFEPVVRYEKFLDSSISLKISMRAKDYASQSLITHELLKKLFYKYKEENIVMPFPTRMIIQK